MAPGSRSVTASGPLAGRIPIREDVEPTDGGLDEIVDQRR